MMRADIVEKTFLFMVFHLPAAMPPEGNAQPARLSALLVLLRRREKRRRRMTKRSAERCSAA